MSKHPVISKSKTLDVPIIITSPTIDQHHETSGPCEHLVPPSHFTKNHKLDKALSLDSHSLEYPHSLSSTSSSINTSLNSTESTSNNSIHQFQFYRQQFLTPPPVVSYSSSSSSSDISENINADFKLNHIN